MGKKRGAWRRPVSHRPANSLIPRRYPSVKAVKHFGGRGAPIPEIRRIQSPGNTALRRAPSKPHWLPVSRALAGEERRARPGGAAERGGADAAQVGR